MPNENYYELSLFAFDESGRLQDWRNYLMEAEDIIDSNVIIGHFAFVKPEDDADIMEIKYVPTGETRILPFNLKIPEDSVGFDAKHFCIRKWGLCETVIVSKPSGINIPCANICGPDIQELRCKSCMVLGSTTAEIATRPLAAGDD